MVLFFQITGTLSVILFKNGGEKVTIKKKGAAAPLLIFFYDDFTVLQPAGKDRVTAEFQVPFNDLVLLTGDGHRRTHSHYLAAPGVKNPDATRSVEIAVVRSAVPGVWNLTIPPSWKAHWIDTPSS